VKEQREREREKKFCEIVWGRGAELLASLTILNFINNPSSTVNNHSVGNGSNTTQRGGALATSARPVPLAAKGGGAPGRRI
jgi:hypothetical protein